MNLGVASILIVFGAVILAIVFLFIAQLGQRTGSPLEKAGFETFLASGRTILYIGIFLLGAVIILGSTWPVLFVPLSSDQFSNVLGIFGLGLTILVLSANAIQQVYDEKGAQRTNELLESIRDLLDKRLGKNVCFDDVDSRADDWPPPRHPAGTMRGVGESG